jgi:hypothetical protein
VRVYLAVFAQDGGDLFLVRASKFLAEYAVDGVHAGLGTLDATIAADGLFCALAGLQVRGIHGSWLAGRGGAVRWDVLRRLLVLLCLLLRLSLRGYGCIAYVLRLCLRGYGCRS